MRIFILFLAGVITVVLLACGNGASGNGSGEFISSAGNRDLTLKMEGAAAASIATPAPAATAAPAAMAPVAPEPRGAAGTFREGGQFSGSALQTAQRKIISSASVSLEVEVVEDAIDQVRAIVDGMGGFIEQLSSSGEPGHDRANITVRVPQENFLTTLELIEDLGKVRNRNLGSEDVSEQFIDLEARLKSSLQEERSLLSLLEKAGVVSEVLAIERELFRIRADIERFQGQLNFLQRRVDLSTISISLSPPERDPGELPSASVTISVSDVGAAVDAVKVFAASFAGKVDRVFLSEREGKQEARLTLLVFSSEFGQAVGFLEAQGKVRNKEVFEGTVQNGVTAVPEEKPEARIAISLIAEDDSVNVGLIAAIAGPLGGIALVALLGYLLFGGDRRFGRGF